MDMKLTLKKNRKSKKKAFSLKAKKRVVYSENAIMPIWKMVGGAAPLLDKSSLPNDNDLQNSMAAVIMKYPTLDIDKWIDCTSGTYTLKSLKAVDAVKDGAPAGLADFCFSTSIVISRKNPTNLKAFVKGLFDNLVSLKELTYIPYTRIKNKIFPAPELPNVHYDYYIPDCGPSYSQGNGKTPEVLTSSREYPEAIYSLGNKLDTGPSSRNTINLHCSQRKYTIPTTTMEVLGYNNLEIQVISTNPIDYKILIGYNSQTPPPDIITRANIDKYAIGNESKKTSLTNANTSHEKKKYLFIKSLGDTLIVYHWLWACLSAGRSTTDKVKTISLLTCDSVVALQAFILGHTNVRDNSFLQNAQFVLNYTEKGEDHISKVYYKGQPPDYDTLFKTEKNIIIKRYDAEIFNFEKFIISNGFTFGENKTYRRPELVTAIINGLKDQKHYIEEFLYSTAEDYKMLKGYELMPLIQRKKQGNFVLNRGKNQFSANDTIFLGLGKKNKPMPLEYLVTNNTFHDDINQDIIIGGSLSDNTSKIIGGRNDHDILGEYYYKIKDKDPDETAILNLQRRINQIYLKIIGDRGLFGKNIDSYLKQIGITSSHYPFPYNNIVEQNPYIEYIVESDKQSGKKILNTYYGGDSGSLYEILTYYFHIDPDYSISNISTLITNIINNYSPYVPYVPKYRSRKVGPKSTGVEYKIHDRLFTKRNAQTASRHEVTTHKRMTDTLTNSQKGQCNISGGQRKNSNHLKMYKKYRKTIKNLTNPPENP